MSAAALGSYAEELPAVHLKRWIHLAGAALMCGLVLWCCARKRPSPAAADYKKIVPLLGTPKRGPSSSSPDSVVEVAIDIPTPTAPPLPPQPPQPQEGSVALLLDFAQEPLHFPREEGQDQAPPYSPSAGSAAAALAAVAERLAAATLTSLTTHSQTVPGHPWYGRRGLRYGPPPLPTVPPTVPSPTAPGHPWYGRCGLRYGPPPLPTVPPSAPSPAVPLRPPLRCEESVHDGRLHHAFTSADADGSGGLSKPQLYLALAQVDLPLTPTTGPGPNPRCGPRPRPDPSPDPIPSPQP